MNLRDHHSTMPSLDKMMMNVNSCCCGCSLRTGTLILLWLSLIGAILQVLSLFAPSAQIPHDSRTQNGFQTYEDNTQEGNSSPPVFVYFQFQFITLTGIFAAFGLYSVSNMALFWIVGVLFLILALFIQATIHNTTQKSDHVALIATVLWTTIIVGIIAGIIGCALNWYYTSVVYRYYKQLKSEVANSYQGGNFNAPPKYDA